MLNELAKRMLQAGNFNKLAQMREQAFYADATAQLAPARSTKRLLARKSSSTPPARPVWRQLNLQIAAEAAGCPSR